MIVDGSKIKRLIDQYGEEKGLPEKSRLVRFCEEYGLNYNQWNAYTRGAQDIGIKIIQVLMDIFPEMDLNWLLKKDYPSRTDSQYLVEEGDPKYSKAVVDNLYKSYREVTKTINEIHKMTAPK